MPPVPWINTIVGSSINAIIVNYINRKNYQDYRCARETVYVIRWIKQKNQCVSVNIGRLLWGDPFGVLYIGSSDTRLSDRHRLSVPGIMNAKTGWARWIALYAKHNGNKSPIPLDELALEFYNIESENALILENKCLEKYAVLYGELPPFNSKL